MPASPPPEAELVLVVAASFFLVEPGDLDVPDVVWMTLPDLYSCMVSGGQSELKRLLASQVFSHAMLSFPATESKFLEYKAFLVSQGITKIQRVSWDELIESLQKRSNGNSYLKRKGQRMDADTPNEVPVAALPLKELIKLFWEETGGNNTKLFEKITGIGRATTMISVTSAKSNLLSTDKWVPSGGLPTTNRIPRSPRTSGGSRPSAEKSPGSPASPLDMIRKGTQMVKEGLAMIEKGFEGVEAFQSKVHEIEPLLEALKGLK